MKYMSEQGAGVVVWLDHEGRGNGMMADIASQKLKRQGLSQSEAYEALGYPRDARRYETAAQILRDLGVKSIVVMTAILRRWKPFGKQVCPSYRNPSEMTLNQRTTS